MYDMAKWNRRRLSAVAGTLVLAIWIPVALAQNYFRYSAYILPVTGLLAVVFYGVLWVTAPSISGKINDFHHKFGTENPLRYTAIVAIIGGALILLLGMGEWYAINKSQQHVGELRKADAPYPAVPPPAQPAVPSGRAEPQLAQAAPIKKRKTDRVGSSQSSRIGDDNTVVNAPVPSNLGNGNTIVGATDASGNSIYNRVGTAIGRGAKATDGVAIGAGANGGAATTPLVVQAPCSVFQNGGTGNSANPNCGPRPPRVSKRDALHDVLRGGVYVTTSEYDIETEVAVAKLTITVKVPSLVDFAFFPPDGSPQIVESSVVGNGSQTIRLSNVSGHYQLEVRTKNPEPHFQVYMSCKPVECESGGK